MEFLSGALAVVSAFIGGLFQAPVFTYMAPLMSETPRATILFGGDMMFDRSVRTVMDEQGGDFIFSCTDALLSRTDLVVANLEGPVTSNPSVSVGTDPGGEGNYTFTFPTSTATLLARHNIKLVNIGNNHIMNFGHEGLLETKRLLDSAGVGHFGDPDLLEDERVERMTLRGVPLSFVNWSDWTPVGNPAASNGAGLLDPTIEQIRRESESGRIVVVYAHWGEEYAPPPERVKRLARQFVDAGADIVIGSHPHIVQEHELYSGKHIYYSLGNFVFDQYWSEEVRRGLLLRVEFTRRGVSRVEEVPIYNRNDRRPCAE
jgi:poly-gamma-glutamate capsule biosynthesis protein CapA/YwtB (metallophosphatase superfamily)